MTAMPSLPFAGTYPLDAGFWVPASDADEYPWRFGDLVATPESPERFGAVDSKGRPWRAFRAKFTAGMGQQEGAPRPPLGIHRPEPLRALGGRHQISEPPGVFVGIRRRHPEARVERVRAGKRKRRHRRHSSTSTNSSGWSTSSR